MNNTVQARCDLFLRNRDAVHDAFPWDSGMMHVCCGNLYTMRGAEANTESIKECKRLMNERMGIFSNFRSTARNILICMMDLSGDAEGLLTRANDVYERLKKVFFTSSYLPVTAMILAEQVEPSHYDELVARTREIYDQMKQQHPMLTSAEDSVLCALLAMSGLTDAELIDRMETSYDSLKKSFFFGNSVQAVSHVMALTPGDIGEKCERMMQLFEALKNAGSKWGTSYELPVLAILCEDPRRNDELVNEILECETWLKAQKGFGFFSSVSRAQRLMYAGLLTQDTANGAADAAVVNGTMSIIIAEQVAISAAVAASVAASSSSSSR